MGRDLTLGQLGSGFHHILVHGQIQLSEGNKNFMKKWTSSYSDYILEKNLSLFCPCPENLNGAEFSHNGLICLAEGISWQVCGLNENVPLSSSI